MAFKGVLVLIQVPSLRSADKYTQNNKNKKGCFSKKETGQKRGARRLHAPPPLFVVLVSFIFVMLHESPAIYYPIVCKGKIEDEILQMEYENALPHGWQICLMKNF